MSKVNKDFWQYLYETYPDESDEQLQKRYDLWANQEDETPFEDEPEDEFSMSLEDMHPRHPDYL